MLKVTIKTPERHVFIANFEHSSHLFLVFFIAYFQQVNNRWVIKLVLFSRDLPRPKKIATDFNTELRRIKINSNMFVFLKDLLKTY